MGARRGIHAGGMGAAVGLAGLIQGIGPTLVIAAGSVTPTHRSHAVDTEAMAAADNLDTIVPTNAAPTDVLALRQLDGGRQVTILDGMGNIITEGGSDLNLLNTTRRGYCFWDGTIWGVERFTG